MRVGRSAIVGFGNNLAEGVPVVVHGLLVGLRHANQRFLFRSPALLRPIQNSN
eukprot:SAG31_NODE_62_length_28678_cov_21.548270_25_plen_53_part_00